MKPWDVQAGGGRTKEMGENAWALSMTFIFLRQRLACNVSTMWSLAKKKMDFI
jgi:hypothetical protein